MVLEYSNIKIEIFIKEVLKIIKNKVKEFIFSRMVKNCKVFGIMMNVKKKVKIFNSMKEIFKIVINMIFVNKTRFLFDGLN